MFNSTDTHVSYSRIYELVVRQEPKQARMCGVGGKGIPSNHHSLLVSHSHAPIADRRPIDPPPIVQLRVVHPSIQSGTLSLAPQRQEETIVQGLIPVPLTLEPLQMMRPMHRACLNRSFRILTISCSPV
jgi:hypothetical protein